MNRRSNMIWLLHLFSLAANGPPSVAGYRHVADAAEPLTLSCYNSGPLYIGPPGCVELHCCLNSLRRRKSISFQSTTTTTINTLHRV